MDGLKLEGMDAFINVVEDLDVSIADEKRAVRKALQPIKKEIIDKSPKKKGRLARLKEKVSREELATVGTLNTPVFYDIFQEFGTSQQKKHVGYFEKSVNKKQDEALEILSSELFKNKM